MKIDISISNRTLSALDKLSADLELSRSKVVHVALMLLLDRYEDVRTGRLNYNDEDNI